MMRMSRALRRHLVLLAGAGLTCTSAAVLAQAGASVGEGRHYGGCTGETPYSPPRQSNATNFNTVAMLWEVKTDRLGRRARVDLFVASPQAHTQQLLDAT